MNMILYKKYSRNFFATLFIAFLVFQFTITEAQVHIQTTMPTVGLVQKNQLWNLLLINGMAQSLNGRLSLTLRDRQNGTDLLTATTTNFTLPTGTLQVNVNQLNPIQYNYSGMEPDGSINNLLPSGAYSACYSFVKQDGNKQELIAEECVSFDVEPLSPPMLIIPSDSSKLELQPAQFSWTAPTPSAMIKRLYYEILITEIKPGQKANEALQENIPFYNSSAIKNNFLNYPAALPPFEKDKWYAWQVIAKDGSSYAGKSETWTFSIPSTEIPPVIPPNASYMLLKANNSNSGVYYADKRNLYVKYYSFDKQHETLVRLLSSEGKVLQEIKRNVLYGDNYLSFRLGNQFSSGQIYTLEITGEQKIKYSALFSIQ